MDEHIETQRLKKREKIDINEYMSFFLENLQPGNPPKCEYCAV